MVWSMRASVLAVGIAHCAQAVGACKVLDLTSDVAGSMKFNVLTEQDISNTGRPSFYDEELGLYLFHDVTGGDLGRWTVGEVLFGESAVAVIDSWSVHPTLIHAAHDSMDLGWLVTDSSGGWAPDPSLQVSCDGDAEAFQESTVFFDSGSGTSPPDVSGFFVEVEKSSPALSAGPLYVLVGRPAELGAVFMYRYVKSLSPLWVVGQHMGTDIGVAFVADSALTASEIRSDNWQVLHGNKWVVGNGKIITGDSENNVYFNLRKHRSIQFVPAGQEFYVLRNSVPIPAVGFGTGGLRSPATSIEAALRNGYRFLDLAREYRNERVVASLFEKNVGDDSFPAREEIFLLTKVWPTELGFAPTTSAIYQSLRDLKTSYLDSYLLHWPT
jgi:hypothetical protein